MSADHRSRDDSIGFIAIVDSIITLKHAVLDAIKLYQIFHVGCSKLGEDVNTLRNLYDELQHIDLELHERPIKYVYPETIQFVKLCVQYSQDALSALRTKLMDGTEHCWPHRQISSKQYFSQKLTTELATVKTYIFTATRFISWKFLVSVTNSMVSRNGTLISIAEPSQPCLSEVSPHSLIMVAAAAGDLLSMKQILKHNVSARYSFTAQRLTPMAVAIESGQFEIVRYLLENGVDIEGRFGKFDIAPLAQALRCRQFSIVNLLIDRGACLTTRDRLGWMPLFYLWSSRTNLAATHYLKLLAKRQDFAILYDNVFDLDGWSIMHRAAAFGARSDVEFLIECGLNPLIRIRDTVRNTACVGWTPLHKAAWYGNIETVQTLLPLYRNCNMVDARTNEGTTALHIAVQTRDYEITKVLLQHGADPCTREDDIRSPDKSILEARGNSAWSLAREHSKDCCEDFRALFNITSSLRESSVSKQEIFRSGDNTSAESVVTSDTADMERSYVLIHDTSKSKRRRFPQRCTKLYHTTSVKGSAQAHLGDTYNTNNYYNMCTQVH